MSALDPNLDTALDEDLRTHDPDRWLSSRFVADPVARARLVALYTLDGEWRRVAGLAKTPLSGEVRLAWWRDAVDGFANGGPAEHPAMAALGLQAVREFQDGLQAVIEARHADLTGHAPNAAAAHALMAVAARLLDPAAKAKTLRAAAQVWASKQTDALPAANTELKALPVNAFPAVAHVTLVGGQERVMGDLEKRARITLAVLRGRL